MNRCPFVAIVATALVVVPIMAECNTAPTVTALAVEAFDETIQVDVLAVASDAEGHPLVVSGPSTTCDADVTVDFDLLLIDPDPAIRHDCSVSFNLEDELGETTLGTVTIRVIAGLFSDTFESGNTDAWSG